MSFLPLAGTVGPPEYDAMYPYDVVEERQAELRRQRIAVGRADRDGVPRWRRGAGRALASLAVAVGVPRSQRATTRCRVGAALTFVPPRP